MCISCFWVPRRDKSLLFGGPKVAVEDLCVQEMACKSKRLDNTHISIVVEGRHDAMMRCKESMEIVKFGKCEM